MQGIDALGSIGEMTVIAGMANGGVVPSKIRTAVGKSLTLRAALTAAVMTEVDGTRS